MGKAALKKAEFAVFKFFQSTLKHQKSRQNLCLQNFEDRSYWEAKEEQADSVDPDEEAHNEPPHLDLYCLQIHLFSFPAF